jgi:serine protease Do
MRFYSAIPVLAASLACFAPQIQAQIDVPQVFDLLSESGMSGSRLGVHLRDIDPDRANVIKLGEARGVEVTGVEDDSPAEQAGLKAGDVLLSYNGENIVGAQQLGRLVSETPRGRKVKIEYWRDGKTSTLIATTAAPKPMTFPRFPGEDIINVREFNGPLLIPTPELVWKTPQFGFVCESLDPQLADFFGVKHGVLVRSVVKDSPAGKAGLRAGDVVTQIGERSVNDPKDITTYVHGERRSSRPFSLEVTREHRPMTMKVNLPPDNQAEPRQ